MAKNSYVFSTLANDQQYVNWVKNDNGNNEKQHPVLIKGGTGVANDRFVTPLGVATEVDENQLAELKKNPCFIEHEKLGFIVVQSKKADPEKVAADMDLKDKSAPITPSDYKEEGEEALTVTTN